MATEVVIGDDGKAQGVRWLDEKVGFTNSAPARSWSPVLRSNPPDSS